jgi:hypothetical protein
MRKLTAQVVSAALSFVQDSLKKLPACGFTRSARAAESQAVTCFQLNIYSGGEELFGFHARDWHRFCFKNLSEQ